MAFWPVVLQDLRPNPSLASTSLLRLEYDQSEAAHIAEMLYARRQTFNLRKQFLKLKRPYTCYK